MQSNILNKFKKIIILFAVAIITLQSVCFADFTEAQQAEIQGWVRGFVNNNDTGYTLNASAITMGYQRQKTYSTYDVVDDNGNVIKHYEGTCIWLCCATYISMILNEMFYIDIGVNRHATDGYAKPDGYIREDFKKVPFQGYDMLEAGDLVFWGLSWIDGVQYYAHMGMYIGEGWVTDCSSNIDTTYGKSSDNTRAGCYVRPAEFYGDPLLVLRYEKGATSSSGLGPNGPLDDAWNAISEWKYKYVVIPFRTQSESSIDKDKTFEYQGITKAESVTEEDITDEVNGWRFPSISDLLEWILNFMVTTVKSIFVGFGTLVQVLVSYYIDAASGEDVSNRMSNGMMAYFTDGGLKKDVVNSITMEKIVYNQVPLLDVDVFNGNVAGGKTVSSSSLIVIIRNIVANLYMAIRTISLIGLLLALIYFGIKFVITGIAEQKAEYKQKLLNWAVAFFIVFGIHYFLIAVMKINEVTVNMLSNVGSNIATQVSGGQYYDLANAMRELTYQSGVVKSMLSTCLYLALVYYLVKFIIIYFKRLFITLILILFAPIIGIKFAMDKLKFKESSTMTTWAKEYIFSVGTQTIHALVYTIFIGITYSMVVNIETAQMAVCILAFMFFRFMTEAEKLLRKFLKLSGGSASSIMGDANSTKLDELIGWTMIGRITGYANKTPVPNYIKNRYKTSKKFMKHQFENEYVKMKRNEYIDKYNEAYRPNAVGQRIEVTSNVDKQIETVLKKEFSRKVDNALNSVSSKWTIARSANRIAIGIPIGIVENTLVGTGLVATGGYTVITALGGAIKGYKSSKEIAKYRAKDGTYRNLQEWVDNNATQKVAQELRKQYLYTKDDQIAENQEKLALLHEARAVEVAMQYEVAKQKQGLLKGADGVDPTTKIQNELARTYTRDLKRRINDIMKTVDREEIQTVVQEYMKKHKKYALTMEDFREIAESIDDIKVLGTDMDAYLDMAGLTQNIKQETIAKFISEITEQDGIGNKITLDAEVMEQVKDNLQEKIENTTDEKEKRSLLNAMKCIDDKRHEINGQEKLNVYSNLSPEEQQQVKGILQEAAEETNTAEQQIKGLTPEQIVDTIKKAVDKDGSIQKDYPALKMPEFEPILEQVQKMKEINELAKEMGDPPVYKDVAKLVETMIKNTDIRLEHDNLAERLDEIRRRNNE